MNLSARSVRQSAAVARAIKKCSRESHIDGVRGKPIQWSFLSTGVITPSGVPPHSLPQRRRRQSPPRAQFAPLNVRQDSFLLRRGFHATARRDSVTIAAGLGAVAVAAKIGQYGIRAYKEWEANPPEVTETPAEKNPGSSASGAKSSGAGAENKVNFLDRFGFGVGTKYYEGGFEDKMTRREAALILGVRESASLRRIKDSHKRLLILNHPDTGGSTFIAGKINEAKELLIKGRKE